MPKAVFPIIISSPSGGGKTTVTRLLLQGDKNLERVVTCTTRKARSGEKNGIDYHFWTEEQFQKSIKRGLLAEWAKVHVNYYGVPKKSLDSVLKKGKNPVLVIDVQGAKTVLKYYPDSILIFLIPPNWKELKKRLLNRNDNTKDIEVRFTSAKKEIGQIKNFEYIVVNGDLKKAVQDIKSIILAEKLKAKRQILKIKLNCSNEYSIKEA